MAGEALPAASISKWTGLYRSVDPLSISAGAMGRADNIVVPGPSLLRPRRGFQAGTSASGGLIRSLGFYSSFAVFTTDASNSAYTAQAIDSLASSFNVARAASDFTLAPATLSAYGFNIPASAVQTRWFTGNGNLYTTTNFGVARTAAPPGPLSGQGWAPAGMDTPIPAPAWSLDAAGNFLPALGSTVNNVSYPNGSQVAYRFTYRYTDANGNVHRGPPSGRTIVTNTTAGARGVDVSAFPTSMCLPGTIIETWRTATIAAPANGGDNTGDEMFKVDERVVSGANIGTGANGYLLPTASFTYFASFVDNTPDSFLVEPLYTNPTTGAVNGLGIGNANTPPPACSDLFTFKGRTYYCNTQEIERLTLQIRGTGTGGIVDGDTFYVNGQGFQWVAGVSAAAPGFIRVLLWLTGGTRDAGTILANLYQSASAAATAINSAFGWAGYFDGASGLPPPGALSSQILAAPEIVNGLGGYLSLRRLAPGAASITVAAGVGAGRGWNGALATRNTSDSNRQPANLMQSQFNDPESVPPAFTEAVGRAAAPILRGRALRDAAYIFKGAGDGLWKFTDDGTGALVVSPVDQTVNLVAPQTVDSLENALFCLTDKGVIRVTDGGTPEAISTDRIQDDLSKLMQYVGPATLASVAFAVAYESERLYVLCLPESPNATTCTVQYVYNLQSDAWTRWTLPDLTCGGVNPANDELYFGRQTTLHGGNILWQERKALDDSDYQDPGFASTVPAVPGYAVVLSVLPGGPTPAQIATGSLAGFSNTQPGSTYCRRADGSLVLLPPGAIRVEPEGVLTERGSTNYCLSSHAVGDGNWSTFGTAPTITLNTAEVPAPDGTFTATKAVYPAVTYPTNSWLYQLTGSGANSYASIYMRMPPGQSGTIYLNGRQYGADFTECHVTDKWQRFTVPSGGYIVIGYGNDNNTLPGGAGGTFYLWGAQVEANLVTSLIHTTAAPVTRTSDQVSFTNPLVANPAQWAVSFKATTQAANPWANQAALAGAGVIMFFQGGGWSVSSGGFANPTGAVDDVAMAVNDGANSKWATIRGLLTGASPLAAKFADNAGALSSVPAGDVTGPGTGLPQYQAATIQLGQDGFGTGPFTGWFTDIVLSTGIAPGPTSSLVFPGNVTASYAPGDLIQYSPNVNASYLVRVTGATWDPIGNTTAVTLDRTVAFNPGDPFTLLKGIQCRLELLPLTAGAPLYEKQWQTLYLYLRTATFESASVSYSTEKQQNPVTYPLAGPVGVPWLYDETLGFGRVPWGGPARDVILKLALDQAAARSAELTLGLRFGDAIASWELSAIRVPYDPTTMRVVR